MVFVVTDFPPVSAQSVSVFLLASCQSVIEGSRRRKSDKIIYIFLWRCEEGAFELVLIMLVPVTKVMFTLR